MFLLVIATQDKICVVHRSYHVLFYVSFLCKFFNVAIAPLTYTTYKVHIEIVRLELRPHIPNVVCYLYTIVRTLIIPFHLSAVDQSAPPSVTLLMLYPSVIFFNKCQYIHQCVH